MKRVICCDKCSWKPQPQYKGEWFKRIHGTAKKNYRCDWCGADIKAGDKCAAEAMGTNNQRYFPWESDYIEA